LVLIWEYVGTILGRCFRIEKFKYWDNIGKILGISQDYVGNVLGMCWEYGKTAIINALYEKKMSDNC